MLKSAGILLAALLMIFPTFAENRAFADVNGSKINTLTDSLVGMKFVLVPGGCFLMGSDSGNSDEKPVHEVCLTGFYIGAYEVTQEQWLKVMGSNPSRFNRCGDNCPVEQVSSNDALDFIGRLNRQSGNIYRLPTEAEWEYVCRSGGKDDKYCGGKDIDSVAWFDRNSDGRTHPVGQKQPNGLGAYDMSGNVWEWVLDWKGDYPGVRLLDPVGPVGATRMRRGGSWQYGTGQSSATWRSSGYPDDRALDIGFRLVLPLPHAAK